MFGLFASYTKDESRNLVLYLSGLMTFKFALESMNACMNGIVINRGGAGSLGKSFAGTTWAQMQGLNLAMQVVGTLLIGPLIRRWFGKSLLAYTILCFGVVALVVPILEASTGGRIPGTLGSKDPDFWGNWSPYIVYPIYGALGLFAGMLDMLRRVIPADIIGGDPVKLREFDSTVHAFWEAFGTVGSLLAYLWIGYFGWGFAFSILPIAAIISFTVLRLITPTKQAIEQRAEYLVQQKGVSNLKTFGEIFYSFFHSVWLGSKLVLSQRSLIWLLPSYSLALLLHKYLESTLFPFYTKAVLNNTDVQTILNGGSNFGELMGGMVVLFFARKVKTPIPWLRLDVLLISFVWVLPFIRLNAADAVGSAWILAPFMALISFGWSAGDVSLAAYIQSRLNNLSTSDKYTTPLGAVMSFLYVVYLITYYVLNLLMSMVRDNYTNAKKSNTELFVLIGGVFMSVCGVIILASTFIPRGSFAFNPDPDAGEFDDDIIVNETSEKGLRKRNTNKPGGADYDEVATIVQV